MPAWAASSPERGGASAVESGSRGDTATQSRAGSSAHDALVQLRAFTKNTHAARGRFTQELLDDSDSVGRQRAQKTKASGDFAFVRPGRFYWRVQKPNETLIVTDSDKLYFYDKDLEQVTVRQARDALGTTPAAVLFGSGDLDAQFTWVVQPASSGLSWVEGTPRDRDSGFDSIRVGMRDGLPRELIVRDGFGQTSRFRFEDIEANVAVPESLFHFTPPAGVDVIE